MNHFACQSKSSTIAARACTQKAGRPPTELAGGLGKQHLAERDSDAYDVESPELPPFVLQVDLMLTLPFRTGILVAVSLASLPLFAQTLEQRLQTEPASRLAADAQAQGDPGRGAILFHQPTIACSRCHDNTGDAERRIGPDLTRWESRPADTDIVDAVLFPSKVIRKGYEPLQVVTTDGRVVAGLLTEETTDTLVLTEPVSGHQQRIPLANVATRQQTGVSVMPGAQVNQLSNRQQFLDLISYLFAVRDGGPQRAKELQPPPSLFALKIPEYEARVDHSGLIRDLDQEAYERGQKIYNRLCINCHGDLDRPGSLPTALRFAEGKFRNGSDPHSIYRTLTHGFGFMVAQTWMVPQQKYDVIHYIREMYLRTRNPSQYADLSDRYLADLPKGDTRGPAPLRMDRWATMDYGPRMINTYEVGSDGSNFAYKGIAVRLDAGPGGVGRGSAWMIFDHDTLRMSAAWTADPASGGDRFIDWRGIHFDGAHGAHPRIVGDLCVQTKSGPGWSDPATGNLQDTARIVGRDGRRYGPLPREWAQYHGLVAAGDRTIIDYSVGTTRVQEMPGLLSLGGAEAPTVFLRTFNIGPRDQPLTVVVGTCEDPEAHMMVSDDRVTLAPRSSKSSSTEVKFDGKTWLQTRENPAFDMTTEDFTIKARIRTSNDGTIFSRTRPEGKWIADGKTFFIRDGRLCYDIGWVGVVTSRGRVNDGEWHDVALIWRSETAKAELFIDGEPQGSRVLRPKNRVENHVARIGFTAPDFPSTSGFDGHIEDVQFWQRIVNVGEPTGTRDLKAHWRPAEAHSGLIKDLSRNGHDARVVSGAGSGSQSSGLAAGLTKTVPGSEWLNREGRLCLTIPAGAESLSFGLWFAQCTDESRDLDIPDDPIEDIPTVRKSNPSIWRGEVTTHVDFGDNSGPFAVDHLLPPETNPWLARTRLTGLDFVDDGDRMVVCCWDGDVWMVRGLRDLTHTGRLHWKRIAAGLFQPLGIKIISGQIFVACRDQIVVLEDHTGDEETDFWRCFNNDHQVTEHFHEFAMGLQVDDYGNLYYAKSARHAKTALVPHHGTLLRVSADGQRTDILANGFRAANGVCLNPDGSFVVTDQEGHWNPKNRINWVKEGGFYGNMFGYHDVEDSSDAEMEQPLCWITNAFDRSPGELLWVDSEAWGPLHGSLLNLSYGYGKVYVVPFEMIDGQPQGGMCEFPVPQFPTGTMRGRFRKDDGHLYVCGMFAWAGSRTQPGGLYRLRATGRPSWLPKNLTTHADGVTIELTDAVDVQAAADPNRYAIKVWSLKRTANYGSDHYDEHPLEVTNVAVREGGHAIRLTVPEITPTWCMEIVCELPTPDGRTERRVIHNTIHALGEIKNPQ